MARTSDDESRSVTAAVKWLNWVAAVEADQRKDEEECLEFQDAEGNGGWPSDARAGRAGGRVDGSEARARPRNRVGTLEEPAARGQSLARQAKRPPALRTATPDHRARTPGGR